MDIIQHVIADNIAIICVALALMVVDILTGLLKAFQSGKYDSSLMREGLYHKIANILIIFVSAILEIAFNIPNVTFDFSVPMLGATCVYIIFNEFCSIVENLSAINPELASLVAKWLDKAKKDA